MYVYNITESLAIYTATLISSFITVYNTNLAYSPFPKCHRYRRSSCLSFPYSLAHLKIEACPASFKIHAPQAPTYPSNPAIPNSPSQRIQNLTYPPKINAATSASIAELCVDAFAGLTNGPAHDTLSISPLESLSTIESALSVIKLA